MKNFFKGLIRFLVGCVIITVAAILSDTGFESFPKNIATIITYFKQEYVMDFVTDVLGYVIGFLSTALLPIIFPFLRVSPNRKRKTQDDTDYESSDFGWFFSPEDGQVYVIQKSGGDFVECVMDTPNRAYRGDLDPTVTDQFEYWDIVDLKDPRTINPNRRGDADPTKSYPLAPQRYFWLWTFVAPVIEIWHLWRRLLWVTGYVFVPYPFQKVRVRKYTRIDTTAAEWKKKSDFTAYARNIGFEFGVIVFSVETSGNDLLTIRILFLVAGKNARAFMYKAQDSGSRFTVLARDCITAYCSGKTRAEILQAKSAPDKAKEFEEYVRGRMKASMEEIGLELMSRGGQQCVVIDSIDDEDPKTEIGKKYAELEVARVGKEIALTQAEGEAAAQIKRAEGDRDGTIIRADGDAERIQKIATQINAGGAGAFALIEKDKVTQAAQGAGTVILNVGGGEQSGITPGTAAIIQAVKSGNQTKDGGNST